MQDATSYLWGFHASDIFVLVGSLSNPPKHRPQSRALCSAVCALSIAMVLY